MRLTLAAFLFTSVAVATDSPTYAPSFDTTDDIYGLCYYDDQCLFSCGDAITSDDCIDYVGVLGGLTRRILLEEEGKEDLSHLSPRLQRLLEREDYYYANLKNDGSSSSNRIDTSRELQAAQPALNIPYFKSGECLNAPGGFFNQDCCVPTSSDPKPVGKCCPSCDEADEESCTVLYFNPEGCGELDGLNYFWDVPGEAINGPSAATCFYVAPAEPEPAPTPVTPPGIDGDPHILTWNGKWFDYMGQCDLKMLNAPQFDGHQDMEIDVRTKIQYAYSYIEAAAIRIGDDVLEVCSYGDFALNGVDTPYWGGKAGHLGGYELHHTEVSREKHTYDIVLSPTENITLASYKNLVSVKMNVGEDVAKYFANSEGIMGSMSGDLLARDGATVMDNMEAFGQEWQVTDQEKMLFRVVRAPQYPQKCVLPAPKSTSRRLGETTISQEAAETACAHKKGSAFNNCVYDVMAIGDLEMANAGAM